MKAIKKRMPRSRFMLPAMIGIAVVLSAMGTQAEKTSRLVKVKTGLVVKSGAGTQSAVSRSRALIKPGDMVRIHVFCEKPCYIYAVHSSDQHATLLAKPEGNVKRRHQSFPRGTLYYKIDGKSTIERFTLVCSPDKISRLEKLDKGRIAYQRWRVLEKQLSMKSSVLGTTVGELSFPIAGNVRATNGNSSDGLTPDQLTPSAGFGWVVKSYELKVQK